MSDTVNLFRVLAGLVDASRQGSGYVSAELLAENLREAAQNLEEARRFARTRTTTPEPPPGADPPS